MNNANKITYISAFFFLTAVLASCGNRPETDEPDELTGWRQDIEWISDSLPLLHYDLFMYQPRDSLDARLERLEDSLDSLGDMETAMELTRVLASMKCSHTGITFWERCEIRAYPISVIWLDDGLFVTAIDTSHEELIGSRLLTYGERPAEEAAAAMAGMFPATNDVVPRTNAEKIMMLASCMTALGYGSMLEPVEFRFLKEDGDTVTLHLEAVDFTYTNMVDFHSCGSVSLPLWLSFDDCYWHKYIPERKMLYCAYNSCNMMHGYPVEEYVDDLRAVVETEDVRDVVIDLRRNGGGNSLVATPIILWLRELSESTDISISLVIGRWTYSSGILNAMEIAGIPDVTVYGEMTGGSPNHLGEVRTAVLPFSGLTVSYPTKYFETVEGPGTTMVPDVPVPLTPDMFFHGADNVLDSISSRGNRSRL
ncbi:MAG: hypothetical protein JXA64_10925 [Candidatus Fermentibacteraceae bacterium]|nr:hypothetical protein [Candidatus Fermentibacteraceae bacterium]MBN2609617.1 hypothetical protein [Candidatus Fermentibacteraceae bacterium]